MFVFARNLRDGTIPSAATATAAAGIDGNRADAPRIAGSHRRSERDDNIVVSMIERETARGGGGERGASRAAGSSGFDSRWVLMAKHRSGSLEAAVAGVRTRNLIVSSSILLLLTVVIGLIAVSARRAQELARQQMEFVAAVSHELRTPVSVIGAAAGNLADGVVGDPQRVRKYGETIQGEARRLGETVERVLQLAGIAAGRAAAAQTPIAPARSGARIDQRLPDRDRGGRRQRRGRDRRRPAERRRRRDGAAIGAAEPDQQRGEIRRRRRWLRVSAFGLSAAAAASPGQSRHHDRAIR